MNIFSFNSVQVLKKIKGIIESLPNQKEYKIDE